jgi:hypothetical protein
MPQADNTAILREATERRSRQARERAEKAITAAHRSRKPITVAAIARTANVSRSWLYTQTDLIAAIEQIKNGAPSPARTGPQPAATASLQRRLETALLRIKALRAENTELTRRLEAAHGEIRKLRIDAGPR